MSKIFTYNHNIIVPYPARIVFDVVDDVAAYYRFLPNCSGSGITSRTLTTIPTERVLGYMDLSFLGMRYRLDSDNLHTHSSHINMTLLKGPFKTLVGHWQFTPLGVIGSPDEGCKVSLNMQWQYNNAMLALTIGQRFEGIAKQLLDAFIAETARRIQ
jgi:ribosome-associated toxin RatA of RatAB toxin-antitoxin module